NVHQDPAAPLQPPTMRLAAPVSRLGSHYSHQSSNKHMESHHMAALYNDQARLTTFVEWGNEPRDPESGRLLKHLTKTQLDAVYARFPQLREHNIEPFDSNRALPWDDCSTVGGEPASLQKKYARRTSALLADPAPVRSTPTRPVTPKVAIEHSLQRTACHE